MYLTCSLSLTIFSFEYYSVCSSACITRARANVLVRSRVRCNEGGNHDADHKEVMRLKHKLIPRVNASSHP